MNTTMNTTHKIQKKVFMGVLAGLTIILMTSCSAIPAISGVNTLLNTHQSSETVKSVAAPAVEVPTGEGILALEGTLEQIYQQVNPAVVNIRVVQKVSAEDLGDLQVPGFPFFSLPQDQDQSPEQYQSGLGSGFIWDAQGHVVTNNHVVESADKIEVTFNDGTILPAELVGTDPDSDLAVLKVDLPAGISPLQLADSDALKVGQLAIAIGNPFGLEGTMTVGVVSALGRSLPTSEGLGPTYTIPDIIQTDAPINPGNSGGVLVDDQGKVIGVTSAIESSVGQNAGIGFAIPSAIVQKVVPVLISDGHFDHAWLGISGTTLIPDLATAMNLDSTQRGVLVIDVMPNSPAEQAGLLGSSRQIQIEGSQVRVGGDVIVAIDGQPLREMDDLIAYLAGKTEVGQKVEMTILRDGKERILSVTLAARPSTEESTQAQSSTTQGAHLGIYGMDMNETIAQAMDLPEATQGVLVEQVEVGSPADEAGIQGSYKPFNLDGQDIYVGGDVITAVDGQAVTGIQELRAMLSQMDAGQEVSLSILRNGKDIEVSVTLGQ
jgi:serine protease Do